MASYKLPFTGPEVEDRLNKVTDLEKNKANRSEIPSVPVQSVNGKTGDVKLSADDVEARPNTWIPSAADVRADTAGTASSAVTEHNTATDAHNDIRLWLSNVETWVKNLLDADDETLNQTSEMIQYMKDNRELIEQITTGKVSVTDIINNLTTNVSDKPLSAAQGVVLKGLIDALQTAVNAAAKATDLTSHTGNTTVHITAAERTKWNQAVTDVGTLSEEIADYPTKEELVGEVLQALGTPMAGSVDENNVITLGGELADGTYTLKYYNEGEFIEIGTLVISNGGASTVVNLLSSAVDPADLTAVFNDVGYMDGYYASSVSPYYSVDATTFCTGLIEAEMDSVFYIKGVTINPSTYHHRLGLFSNEGKPYQVKQLSSMTDYATLETLADQYYKLTLNKDYINANCGEKFTYIMISAAGSGADCIISDSPIE